MNKRSGSTATATKRRRAAAKTPGGKSDSNLRIAPEFPAGSLEAALSAIEQAVPAREWVKVPCDYFANLDHYLHGASKKK